MKFLFSKLKSALSFDNETTPSYSADEESFAFLKGIIHHLREDGSHVVNGELYMENLARRVEKNLSHRELKLLLAKFHSTFRSIYVVLQDKPFEMCKLNPENRQSIEKVLGIFESSLEFALRDVNGFDISHHHFSLDDMLEETHNKMKKYNS